MVVLVVVLALAASAALVLTRDVVVVFEMLDMKWVQKKCSYWVDSDWRDDGDWLNNSDCIRPVVRAIEDPTIRKLGFLGIQKKTY